MENFNLQYTLHPAMKLIKEYFLKYGEYRDIKKNERFVTQDSVSRIGAYVEDGLFRYSKIDSRGANHVVGYAFSNEFLGDLTTFIEQSELSPVTIEAARNSHIYCLSFQELETFFGLNIETQYSRRILVERSYLLIYSRLLDSYCKNAEEQYQDLLNRCPDFHNYITLKEVASFLRVTPETISHIRKKYK